MEKVLRWFGAIILLVVTAVAGVFLFQRHSRESTQQRSIGPHAPPVPRNELEELRKGLDKILAAVKKSQGSAAREKFIGEFSTILEHERTRLRRDEQGDDGLLDKSGIPRDDNELLYFASARRICRSWARVTGTPQTIDAFVIGSFNNDDARSIENDVSRAARQGRFSALHARAKVVDEALKLFKGIEWPFEEVAGADIDCGVLAGNISEVARQKGGIDVKPVPAWLPILQIDECRALLVRKVFESNGDIGFLFHNGQDFTNEGVAADSLIEARARIEKERTAVLSEIDNPKSRLLSQFQGENGRARAIESINRHYDGVSRFLDSYSEEWPPPSRGAAETVDTVITPAVPQEPQPGNGRKR